MEIAFKRYDNDSINVMSGDKRLGVILAHTNGKWGLYDDLEIPLEVGPFGNLILAKEEALKIYS